MVRTCRGLSYVYGAALNYKMVKVGNNFDAVVAVIIWQFNLQLPLQSVPITTDVVGATPAQGEEYNIM